MNKPLSEHFVKGTCEFLNHESNFIVFSKHLFPLNIHKFFNHIPINIVINVICNEKSEVPMLKQNLHGGPVPCAEYI